jgi:hypothetical protein
VLNRLSWGNVVGLLEPFLAASEGETRFQHLTDVGGIRWVMSTSRWW